MRPFIDSLINSASRAEWRKNWLVVISGMVGLIVAHVHLYSLGLMIEPLEMEFGWSRTGITSGLLIISIVLFLLSPAVGMGIDRFGARPVALGGTFIYCASIAMLSLAQPSITIWWLMWGFVAMGALFLSPTVWVSAITSLFSASRGIALALLLSATGMVSALGPILTYILIENFGWRMAYVIWASGSAVIAIPLLYFCFFSAKDRDHRQRKVAPEAAPPAEKGNRDSALANIRSATFLKLVMAGPVMALVFTAFVVNIVPILTASGIVTATAAGIAGIIGVTQVISRLSCGFFIDHFDARYVGAIVVLFPIVAALILLGIPGSVPAAILAVFFFGIAIGAELDVLAYLSSRFFGPDRFATTFGVIISLAALGTGIGPTLGNLSYDLAGSYRPLLYGIIPLCLVSCIAFASLRPYRMEESADT